MANTASCFFYPLENVKLRFQGKQRLSVFTNLNHIASNLAKNNPIPMYRGIYHALKQISAEEGFFSLYRGVIISLFAGSIANSIFFYVYADGKKRYKYDNERPYSLNTVLISMRAGLVSMFLTAPLWTVKTRMVLYREQVGLSVSNKNQQKF